MSDAGNPPTGTAVYGVAKGALVNLMVSLCRDRGYVDYHFMNEEEIVEI